jgi:hypothetical protein
MKSGKSRRSKRFVKEISGAKICEGAGWGLDRLVVPERLNESEDAQN